MGDRQKRIVSKDTIVASGHQRFLQMYSIYYTYSCKESVFFLIAYHVISPYLFTFTPFLSHNNCVMT